MATRNVEMLDTSAVIIMKVRIKVIDWEVRNFYIHVGKNGTSDGPLSARKRNFVFIRLGGNSCVYGLTPMNFSKATVLYEAS
jgi:hypothetical protein